ncbi:uncharacterized protein PFL1_01123 [Pseudozyma flocculosa PF-1]|uniref:adenosylmethionine decarboxylase n=1 Tax=Pseudozyma flocculosa TaxID=84751 RepID=A0A5C3FEM4_9BASI|nr:uncharacterized protein PFL1_01123 [Pseudozyma flocculosa PF-1]EPQ31791.1 hypothetical protein PFL1_01123 [Pseudozyma flocculosa PF-1]SPO41819.1 related to S-adenosylmethionine decarboxylase (spe-2) [Pseudozyma flocculosa]
MTPTASQLESNSSAADRLAHQKEIQRMRSREILDAHDLAAQQQQQQHAADPSTLSVAETLQQVVELNAASSAANVASVSSATDFHDPCGPFEGPEKLLELWFAEEPADVQRCAWQDHDARQGHFGLRSVPKAVWETMLDIVKCKVLSVIEGAEVDAYLLSESSMFVFPHKLILKTCGTTTLLLGLERLLEIANRALSSLHRSTAKLVSLDGDGAASGSGDASASASASDSAERRLGSSVVHAFYSRKSFMFPERQKGPHRDWMLEVAVLDRFFDFGAAYTVGKMNGDHWLLWMGCEGAREAEAPSSPAAAAPYSASLSVERPLRLPTPCVEDQTLEILMTHLSAASCGRFVFDEGLPHPTRGECYPSQFASASAAGYDEPALDLDKGHALGLALSNRLRLTDLFPSTQLDAFAFEPCGYSANAVMPRRGKTDQAGYWTIHVTPEEESSYASFETNVALLPSSSQQHREESCWSMEGTPTTLPQLVSRVVSTFEPGKLCVTLFVATAGEGASEREKQEVDSNGNELHRLLLKGYKRTDRIAYEFERYDLVFVSFEKR